MRRLALKLARKAIAKSAGVPARKFILIGESGERDQEVFRKIKEEFPGQAQEIRIRDVLR